MNPDNSSGTGQHLALQDSLQYLLPKVSSQFFILPVVLSVSSSVNYNMNFSNHHLSRVCRNLHFIHAISNNFCGHDRVYNRYLLSKLRLLILNVT